VSPEETKAKLREWIRKRSKKPIGESDLDDDTPIIEAGFLSSLDIVEFVLYIESMVGDEIALDDLQPEVFRSTNTMYQAFFAGKPVA
jgi:acyl carrier protein